jgi:hypothetical protein
LRELTQRFRGFSPKGLIAEYRARFPRRQLAVPVAYLNCNERKRLLCFIKNLFIFTFEHLDIVLINILNKQIFGVFVNKGDNLSSHNNLFFLMIKLYIFGGILSRLIAYHDIRQIHPFVFIYTV